jgi:hypothetical protein
MIVMEEKLNIIQEEHDEYTLLNIEGRIDTSKSVEVLLEMSGLEEMLRWQVPEGRASGP